jgi:hypothetical protein
LYFQAEISPMKVSMGVQNRETKEVTFQEYGMLCIYRYVCNDECNRPQTTIEDLSILIYHAYLYIEICTKMIYIYILTNICMYSCR